ncbi:uncharacterized protein [Epargyreus clarus]|uniref:uncharacterized protein n=1 Tax=Epargyreus clarus TaxID=520877 RepID=UPI003C302DC4
MSMPETSAMNSESREDGQVLASESVASIKEEVDVKVKPEPVECLVCVGRSAGGLDVHNTSTNSGTSLYNYLCKFTHADLSVTQNDTKYVCKSCFDLINVLENAELEYMKLKETFESIISKNPLFESHVSVSLEHVKNESAELAVKHIEDDSEDEPLALTKKKRHRKVDKRKKPTTDSKRKVRNKTSKDSEEESVERWAQALLAHAAPAAPPARLVKTEDSDRSQSPTVINHFDGMLKIEDDGFDDDDDEYVPEEVTNGKYKKSSVPSKRGPKPKGTAVKKKREAKVVHQCDQCNAKYTSLLRLEQHKLKHDDSKPPYICEVCGAHYKHKRACDIHVAMHKGISDWKCEECNKLFPSKGALQRHNNIHTGKLNYQCDLCGKSFIHTSSFKMHKLSHSGLKPHACDVCGLALMTRSHLKRHKRIHSGEKRHECPVCGKRFSERYNLLAHSKSHDGSAPAAAAAPRRRLFRCGFCQERFERRYMLERHMSAAHGRALERPPPTPRNTMSKLLKAQALRREPHAPLPPDTDSKINRSPESRASSGTSLKLGSQLSASSTDVSTSTAGGGWASAYAADFALRHDYAH